MARASVPPILKQVVGTLQSADRIRKGRRSDSTRTQGIRRLETSSEYVLGSDAEELRRLRFQHELWSEATRRLLDRAGFAAGDTLLDIGCGPGHTTFLLRERAGDRGRVIGVDSSESMVATLRGEAARREVSNVEALRQDVGTLEGIPAIDGAFARWLFCFLDEPAAVVTRIAAALRPGGRLAVMDYFHYAAMTIEPRSAIFDRVVAAIAESLAQVGPGLQVGRQLPGMIGAAGLRVESLEPICGVGRPGTGIWEWFDQFQASYLPKVVAGGFLSRAEWSAFERFWSATSANPDAFLFPAPMIGIVATKA